MRKKKRLSVERVEGKKSNAAKKKVKSKRIKGNQTHVGEFCETVGRRRSNHADVGPPPHLDVQNGVSDALPLPPLVLVALDRQGRRREVSLLEEATRGVGRDDADLTEFGEEAGELSGLSGFRGPR